MSFELEQLSDPTVVAVGRMEPHSDHRWFATAEEMITGVSSFEQSLDGRWRFFYATTPEGKPNGYQLPDHDDHLWDEIAVPGHIQLAGYDSPQYVNVQYPWDGLQDIRPPQVPPRFNPTACYRRTFTLDPALAAQWVRGNRVTITFDGAESALEVWLNGHYVGYGEDSFTPSEFDISDLLVEGENLLAVTVYKWCSGSWLEDQDFFRFSGLFRSVHLRAYPAVHVRDVRVGTHLGEDLSSARVDIAVDVEGEGFVRAHLAGSPMEDDGQGNFALVLREPRMWSAEDPHLYEGYLEVLDADETVIEFIPLRVGVRRFAVEDGLLKINGQRVVFRGVNRHEFGENGRVFTREETEVDLRLLKQVGANAIRTSHYPNNSFFYELCDEYGFYVIDEMNVETHGLWEDIKFGGRALEDAVPGDNPDWLPALLDRAANMYERDKNHPSVVMWSLGNESLGGLNFLKTADYLRKLDSRPIHYEGVAWDDRHPQSTDVHSEMYRPAAEVEEHLRENREKPMILCEFAHAMGNSFGAVDRYMDLAYREPLFQGGFIWDFADQALPAVSSSGTSYLGYGGDFGDRPHDAEFCGNGIFFADRSPTPRTQEVKYLYQGIHCAIEDGAVTVTNRFNFTSTSAFDAVVTVAEEGRVIAEAEFPTDVAPGASASYQLPVWAPFEEGEYTVDVSFRLREKTVWGAPGFEVAREQAVILVGDGSRRQKTAPVPTLINGIHNIGVQGERFHALFSRLYGGLVSYRYGTEPGARPELLDRIPMPNFWHAPTSNERAWHAPFEDGQWLLASRYAKFVPGPTNPEVVEDHGLIRVTYTYLLPTFPSTSCTVEYSVAGDGHIDVVLRLDPAGEMGDLPEFGMIFTCPPELESLRWYGEGAAESQQDRRGGAFLGVYEADVTSQLTPYLRPQEAGNHTGVRWAEITGATGAGLRFSSVTPMELSALPWSPFEVENAAHHHELPPVSHTYLRPALQRRGVAGDDTWGARPHPEYLVGTTEPLEFRFGFQGLE
ncbi:glycoside hydrolase family 2 TIM barrel-domain containing protein [Actinomyces minihominis]|uniref:glycoside hydrolase family 2 TIM barrel-domain containing protein n=1 Tax=Actinomyces minihominis TaxID=2002838 RepID=UPI000C06B187|nr:glycoside hydrolase family 2 TIM barrel-domain containing protein [Actinomyces minihominis]